MSHFDQNSPVLTDEQALKQVQQKRSESPDSPRKNAASVDSKLARLLADSEWLIENNGPSDRDKSTGNISFSKNCNSAILRGNFSILNVNAIGKSEELDIRLYSDKAMAIQAQAQFLPKTGLNVVPMVSALILEVKDHQIILMGKNRISVLKRQGK